MKKIIAVSCLASLVFMAANTVQAADLATTAAGATLTINDAGSTGVLTFNGSPRVQIAIASTDATYILMSLNTSAAVEDQNEYGIHSAYSGYYQNNTAAADTFGITDVAFAAVTTDLADPFGGWTPMVGGGAAAGGS